jgi:hypothetical protein
MFTVTFEADFKNLQGKIVRANKRLFENQRESVRVLGRKWVEIIREEAPVGTPTEKDPRRKGRTLRESALYRTFIENRTIGFRGYTEQPISSYVVYGTKGHPIVAKNAKALHFFWKKKGNQEMLLKSVEHPGTKANPFTVRAATRLATEYSAALNRVADQWVMDFGA